MVVGYIRNNKVTAVDYYIHSQAPCSSGWGVCPDTATSSIRPRTNNVKNVSGKKKNGITMVNYNRPLAALDPLLDLPIETKEMIFVSWALGPLNRNSYPAFHSNGDGYPRGNYGINFGRRVLYTC